jgi:predicted DNA-binding transcriptional regulator AlpA
LASNANDCWPCPGCNRLLSIQQVSQRLQLPVQTIYKQRSMGLFCPAYKIGRHSLALRRPDQLG